MTEPPWRFPLTKGFQGNVRIRSSKLRLNNGFLQGKYGVDISWSTEMRSPWDCDGDDVHVLKFHSRHRNLHVWGQRWTKYFLADAILEYQGLLLVCSRDRNQRDFQYSTQMYPWITSTLPPDGFMSWSIWMIMDAYGFSDLANVRSINALAFVAYCSPWPLHAHPVHRVSKRHDPGSPWGTTLGTWYCPTGATNHSNWRPKLQGLPWFTMITLVKVVLSEFV